MYFFLLVLLELRVTYWQLVYSNTCWELLHWAVSSGAQTPQGTQYDA